MSVEEYFRLDKQSEETNYEYISLGTEKNDHGTNLRTYRTIPTLQEYMMISSQRIFIEIYQ